MNYRTNNIVYSALLSLLVTVGVYIVFFFFVVYGDYISGDMPDMPANSTTMPNPAPMQNVVHAPAGTNIPTPPHNEPHHPMMWSHVLISCISTYLMTFLLYIGVFRIMLDERHSRSNHIWKIALFTVLTVALFASLGLLVEQFFGKPLSPDGNPHFRGGFRLFRALLSRDAVVAIIVVASSSVIHFTHREQEYRAITIDAQYEALKSKLDPHFLFNALNSLSSLIASGSDRSLEYVDKLSAIYRFTLNHPKQVHLGNEIKFVRDYADLMQIRYEDALVVKIDVPDTLFDHKVFPFSLQTLIENAIKHNTITLKSPLTVSISAEDDYVVVSNPVHPRLDVDNTPGIGLRLLSEQYSNCGKAVLIGNTHDTFTVKIPLL